MSKSPHRISLISVELIDQSIGVRSQGVDRIEEKSSKTIS